MINLIKVWGLIIVLCSAGWACSEKTDTEVQSASDFSLAEHSDVIATVDETPINRYALEEAGRRLVGNEYYFSDDEQVDNMLLESLIQRRAIANIQTSKMTSDEVSKLEAKVEAYREELLMGQYMKDHITLRPIGFERISAFYEENLSLYSDSVVHRFKYLVFTHNYDNEIKQKILEEVSKLKPLSNWKTLASQLTQEGIPTQFKHAEINEASLIEPLRSLVGEAKLRTILRKDINNKVYVVFVESSKPGDAKPLATVAKDIRKRLSAEEARHEVEALAKEVLNQVSVERLLNKSS